MPEKRLIDITDRVNEWREGDIATMEAPAWPEPLRGTLYESQGLRLFGIVARGVVGTKGGLVTKVEREVEVAPLPTTPGSFIRATIRGVPGVVAVLDAGSEWLSPLTASGNYWHDPEHIDLATVEVGTVTFPSDGEGER